MAKRVPHEAHAQCWSDLGCYLIIYKTCSKSERPWGKSLTSSSWLICFFPTESLIGIAINLWVILDNIDIKIFILGSVQFSRSVLLHSLQSHGLQDSRPPCPSATPGVYSNVHWIGDAIKPYHPLLSSSPPAFNLSQHQGLFQWVGSLPSGGQSTAASASASVLPVNIRGWFPLGNPCT